MVGTRSDGEGLRECATRKSLQVFEALELVHWNEWETCCKFENATGMNEAMRKISLLQDIIQEFKKDALGR